MSVARERRDVGRDRSDDRAVYVISVAAELAGVHPQTLRMYERKGLLQPKRTSGNTRRYSQRDIDRIRAIQELTQRTRREEPAADIVPLRSVMRFTWENDG